MQLFCVANKCFENASGFKRLRVAKLSLCRKQGRTQGEELGLTPPLELDILQKRYYLRRGD